MENTNYIADDEISLVEILSKARHFFIKKRRHIIRSSLLLVITLCIFILSAFLKNPPEFSYSQTIAFSFPQAEKNQYPNGAPFFITDLLSRDILNVVYINNKIEEFGVSFDDFVASFSIVYYSDTAPFINAKYQSMLTRKGITNAEIAVIERDFKSELDATSKKQARLTLIAPFSSPISGRVANKVLADVAAEWSNQAINKLGVLNIPNTGFDNLNQEFISSNSAFQVLDYFTKYSTNLRHSLATIKKYPGGETLIDTQSGLGVDSLEQQLDYLNRYWIVAFDYYTQQFNKTDDIDIKSAELSLDELKHRKQIFIDNSHTYKNALKDFDDANNSIKSPDINARTLQHEQSQQLQLESDSLQKLIELGGQQKDSEFRQELTKKSIEFELKASSMDLEIVSLEQRILAAKKPSNRQDIDLDKVKSYKNEIVQRLIDLSASIKRIEDQQIAKFKDSRGVLYTDSFITKSLASSLTSIFYVPFAFIAIFILLILFVKILSNRKESY